MPINSIFFNLSFGFVPQKLESHGKNEESSEDETNEAESTEEDVTEVSDEVQSTAEEPSEDSEEVSKESK